ncbi:LOW QUALITY PROTEIN: protein EARLY HEADING DATE 2-like [Miscanthus floridulus]|uniref:LOW QUALITY PROTEIN: protein EARLY HEADING DATE 2-like n=1 Tax=Miscanthus floridulus TaxID=154761 RepID=UPI00345AC2F4
MMMLSDLSSEQEHEATGSSSYGGDMASYALSPLFLAPAAASATTAPLPLPPPPPQPEEPNKAAGTKRKRSQPGNPDPGAEVIALSPRTLVATNRFVCEICNKGFQRDQNLQLHRRGHNLPWKLRQRSSLPSGSGGRQAGEAAAPRKRVYVCPEPTCVHHDPARALGDLTGIKKHFSRKHGEKRWRCERCGKRYAVQSDWKAHVKGCGTREYRCDCGILFSRKDSLLTHRAFCDALAEESARLLAAANNSSTITTTTTSSNNDLLLNTNNITPLFLPFSNSPPPVVAAQNPNNTLFFLHQELSPFLQPRMMMQQPSPYLDLHMHVDASITTTTSGGSILTDTPAVNFGLTLDGSVATVGHRRLTRDFLGVDGGGHQVEELQLPLCATAAAASRTASCATDLTARQYLGGRLPPVNETWSHNF